MAYISSFSITSVSNTSVYFNYGIQPEEYDDGLTVRREYTGTWKFSIDSNISVSSPCSYSRITPGTNLTKKTLQGQYTYTYQTGVYDWIRVDFYGQYYSFTHGIGDIIYQDANQRHIVIGFNSNPVIDENQNVLYYHDIAIENRGINWNLEQTAILTTESLSFYPRPISFTFTNCSSGKTWDTSKGINSLIINITDFQKYAQQWKAWKYQTSSGTCSSFFDSNNRLAASNLKSVYTYVGSSITCKTGDKISAKMFNDLANIINQ